MKLNSSSHLPLALSVLTIGDAIALVVASLARIEMLLFIAGAGALVLFFVNNAFIIRGLVRRSVASGLFAIEVPVYPLDPR